MIPSRLVYVVSNFKSALAEMREGSSFQLVERESYIELIEKKGKPKIN